MSKKYVADDFLPKAFLEEVVYFKRNALFNWFWELDEPSGNMWSNEHKKSKELLLAEDFEK